MFAEGETYTLIINNVYGVDADEYMCRAVNRGGAKSTKAELVIMSKYTHNSLLDPAHSRNICFITCFWRSHVFNIGVGINWKIFFIQTVVWRYTSIATCIVLLILGISTLF